MRRVLRTFLTPGWAGLTLLFWGAAIAMVLLGRWQLQVSDRKHFDLQNFSYVIQWWAFSGCALVFWGKFVRDAWRRPDSMPSTGGQVVLRGGPAVAGPAQLSTPARTDGSPAVIYRGYVMPRSTDTVARSQGDPMLGDYNDHLWQLALADGQAPRVRPSRLAAPDADEPDPGPDAAPRPAAIESSVDSAREESRDE